MPACFRMAGIVAPRPPARHTGDQSISTSQTTTDARCVLHGVVARTVRRRLGGVPDVPGTRQTGNVMDTRVARFRDTERRVSNRRARVGDTHGHDRIDEALLGRRQIAIARDRPEGHAIRVAVTREEAGSIRPQATVAELESGIRDAGSLSAAHVRSESARGTRKGSQRPARNRARVRSDQYRARLRSCRP
jgi:hypothetical protein